MAYLEPENLRRGPWLEAEDERLTTFVTLLGERKWDTIAKAAGLKRSGKSCRLRWLNYLRPNLKRGHISPEEEQTILQLQQQWGNKWSKIARKLPGRTDNEIKNYWKTHLRKKLQADRGESCCSVMSNSKQGMLYEKGDPSAWKSKIEELSGDDQDQYRVHGNWNVLDPNCWMAWNSDDNDDVRLNSIETLWNIS